MHRKALQRVVGGGKHDGRRLPVPQAGLLDRSLGGGQRGWADGGEELGPRACRLIASEGKKLLLRGFRLQREELVCLSQAEAEEAVGHIDASPQPATSTGSCHSNACSWRLRHILWVVSSRPGAWEAEEAAASCFWTHSSEGA